MHFTYVRDLMAQVRLETTEGVSANLRGIIIHRRSHGGVILFGLQDTSGAIRLKAERSQFSKEAWNDLKFIRKTDFISVSGELILDDKHAPFINVEKTHRLSDELDLPISEADPPYRRAGLQIIRSRLRRKLCSILEDEQFVDIDTNLISVNWSGVGLEPMRVRYPGFGYDTFIAPTPLPQLFEAMIATGQTKFLTVGKCFTTTYRDENSGTESNIIYLLFKEDELKPDFWEYLIGVIHAVASNLETLPFKIESLSLKNIKRKYPRWPPYLGLLDVQEPTIQVFRNPVIRAHLGSDVPVDKGHFGAVEVRELSRLLLPGKHSIIECARETRFGGLKTVVAAIHIDRLLYLLEDTPMRSLRTSTFWTED